MLSPDFEVERMAADATKIGLRNKEKPAVHFG
jgi:hypothetical protein